MLVRGGGNGSSTGVGGPVEDVDVDVVDSEEGSVESRDMTGRMGVDGEVAMIGCEEASENRFITEKRRRPDLEDCEVGDVGR